MAIRERLRRRLRPFFSQEEEEVWRDITEVNFRFEIREVTMTDVSGVKYVVEGVEKLENLAGSEYEMISIGSPGAFMMLLRPSTVRRVDPVTLSIRA